MAGGWGLPHPSHSFLVYSNMALQPRRDRSIQGFPWVPSNMTNGTTALTPMFHQVKVPAWVWMDPADLCTGE